MKIIKIIDASTLIPGPFTTFLLEKHLDCDVIKVEDVNQPDSLINMRPTKDGIGLGYKIINQKKKIIKIDFRKEGVDTIKKEVIDADIFIENFKKGRTYKLGIAYEDLVKINSKLIYCSISGFSTNTPLENKSAHDLNILALSGYLDQQLKLGSIEALPPILLADTFTSYHTALILLSALLKNTKPSNINISMYEALLESMTISNNPQLLTKKDYTPSDFIMSGKIPCYSIYESKDGGKVVVAALEKSLWVDFCAHINREDILERQFDPDISSQVAKEIKKYNRDHWLSDDIDFCVSPILSINEAAKRRYV